MNLDDLWVRTVEMIFMSQKATKTRLSSGPFFRNLPINYLYTSPKKYVVLNNVGDEIVRDGDYTLILKDGRGVLMFKGQRVNVAIRGIPEKWKMGEARYTIWTEKEKYYPKVVFEDGIYSVIGDLANDTITWRKKVKSFPIKIHFTYAKIDGNKIIIDGKKFYIDDFIRFLRNAPNKDIIENYGIEFI